MLQDDIKDYLSDYIEHLFYVEDLDSWGVLPEITKVSIYERVIEKFCDDDRFHAFIFTQDYLLSVLAGINASDDLKERMLDLCHCPVSELFREFRNSHIKNMKDAKEIANDEKIENELFNRDVIKHINEILPC